MNEQFVVPESLAGERVDRALSIVLERSRAEVSALIAAGAIEIGGEVIGRGHRRLQAGEVLDVDLPPTSLFAQEVFARPGIVFGVIFSDEDLIIIDKPAGLVVHQGAGHQHDTLVAGLLERFPDLGEHEPGALGEVLRPGIVHRLDKDTSGVLAVARSPLAFASLRSQLADHSMARRYECLSLNAVAAEQGTIDAPIGRSLYRRTDMAISTSGRPARTHYRVLARYQEPLVTTHLRLALETGRTHQIRVHLAAIGHPIAGDLRYGGGAKALALGRPFLHASELVLVHPRTGEEMTFSSPLPAELAGVLALLS